MDPQESMFLFEITVEELTSFINCREFCIRSQFADVFNINLKDPNEVESFLPKRSRKHTKRITKVRTSKPLSGKQSLMSKVQTGQSILFAINVETLISNMKQYPMELSLWSKVISDYKIGSTQIPWSATFIDNLSKLNKKCDSPPINVKGEHNVFHELTSKRMAVIKLNIKLSYLKDKVSTMPRSLCDESPQKYMNTCYNSKNTSILSSMDDRSLSFTDEPGTIKTIYTGGKRPIRRSSLEKKNNIGDKNIVKSSESIITTIPKLNGTEVNTENDLRKRNTNIACRTLIKSDTSLEKCNRMAIIKSKSCSSVNQEEFNIFNYIFGGNAGPFGNQVYCVGYFTVENDFADSPKSMKSIESAKVEELLSQTEESGKSEGSEKSENPDQPMKQRYKLRVCDSECPVLKLPESGTCAQSICSLDIPQDAAHLITVKKCERVVCDHRKMRELPTPPDDRIFIDLNSLKKDCCDVSQKVEEVVGGMQAKMKFGEDPCLCECECRFGFTKRTTYCNICGGFEVPGDDTVRRSGFDMPFPCPIFHKLVAEKGKPKALSITGSDTKKKIEKDSKHKVERTEVNERTTERASTAQKKGKKKKKDDRFQFNYGYTAPQIGHSRCAMPCTGSLGVVPKSMGWLWTADNIPGMKVAQGWRPGAISKRLLRKLNKAKRSTLPVERVKPTKKSKKRVEEKPTLIICKRNGEYRVEMQVSPENSDMNVDQCSPLVYKITRGDNDERIQKRLRKRQRLVKEAVDKVWVDPYHPEICEKTCLRAYKQAIGLYDPNKPECNCSEEEEEDICSCCNGDDIDDDDGSSDCSSLDLEWEIHFSPPIASQA